MNELSSLIVIVCALLFAWLPANAAVIFSDNWSDLTVGAPAFTSTGSDWVAESGSFSADAASPPGSFYGPQSGTLMFSPDVLSRIHVNFSATTAGTPVDVRFKLHQGNGAFPGNYTFVFGLRNTAVGKSYEEYATLNPGYYGSPSSGFQSWVPYGGGTYGFWAGAPGQALTNDWNYMKLIFNPSNGVQIWQAVDSVGTKGYDDASLAYTKVAEWNNYWFLTSVDQFFLDNSSHVVSWKVDDVVINATVDAVTDNWVRKTNAVQTIYQNGVPHTDRDGNRRMTYDPNLSFFPIGHYAAWVGTVGTETWSFSDFANAGFNTALMQQVSSVAEADAAQSAGIKLLYTEPNDTQVNALKNHPATLGYRMYDEPTGAFWPRDPPLPMTMAEYFQMFLTRKAQVNALDPVHPFFTLDTGWIIPPATEWFAAWNTAGDVSSHDNYPIGDGTTTLSNAQGIPETVSFAVSINNQQKPVWFIPQSFGMPNGDGTYTWAIPTPAQERSMIYTSIISGATGLIYFILDTYISRDARCIGMAPNPKAHYGVTPNEVSATTAELRASKNLWFSVVGLNSELNALKPSVLSPTSTEPYEVYIDNTLPPASADPIRTLLKTNPAGGLTLLLTNIDGVPQNARIRFPNKNYVVAEMYGTLGLTRIDDKIDLACPAWDSRVLRILQPETIGSVKSQPNGTGVACTGIVSAVFTDYLWIESSDRNFGIRVNKTGHGRVVGETVNVGGVIQVLASGERFILATEISVIAGSGSIEPLAITNKALGGATAGAQVGVDGGVGLNNIGLLVRTTGKVTTKGTGWFKIDDGSGVSVKVYGSIPTGNPYVTVTGASSCEKDGFGKYQRAIQATSVVTL